MNMDLSKLKVTPTHTRESKMRELKNAIKKQAKMSNPAYLDAIDKNKKASLYNQMILKMRAEIQPSKKEAIIAEYVRNKG